MTSTWIVRITSDVLGNWKKYIITIVPLCMYSDHSLYVLPLYKQYSCKIHVSVTWYVAYRTES